MTRLEPCQRLRLSRQTGFSYVEVLVAIGLLTIALVPAMNALQAAVAGSAIHATAAAEQNRLRAKMEEVLARPFTTLYALSYASGGNSATVVNATLSDPAGVDRRVVYLYRSDGTALSAADTGLLRISVVYEGGGRSLDTLRGRWW